MVGALLAYLDTFYLFKGFCDSWDAEISYHTLRHWLIKLDSSVGRPRSIESERLLVYVQELMLILLQREKRVLRDLVYRHPKVARAEAERIFAEFLRGLAVLRRRCQDGPICFFVRGYPEDNSELKMLMRRCRLPADHPDYEVPPHIQDRTSTSEIIASLQTARLKFHETRLRRAAVAARRKRA
jgi:hypothetical protein